MEHYNYDFYKMNEVMHSIYNQEKATTGMIRLYLPMNRDNLIEWSNINNINTSQ